MLQLFSSIGMGVRLEVVFLYEPKGLERHLASRNFTVAAEVHSGQGHGQSYSSTRFPHARVQYLHHLNGEPTPGMLSIEVVGTPRVDEDGAMESLALTIASEYNAILYDKDTQEVLHSPRILV